MFGTWTLWKRVRRGDRARRVRRQPLAGRNNALRSADHQVARVDQDYRLGEHRPQPCRELGRQPDGVAGDRQRAAHAVGPFPGSVRKPAAVSSRRASSIPRWEYVSTVTLTLECPRGETGHPEAAVRSCLGLAPGSVRGPQGEQREHRLPAFSASPKPIDSRQTCWLAAETTSLSASWWNYSPRQCRGLGRTLIFGSRPTRP